MTFNKAKVLESAQKALNTGKLPQAIAEYQQILRHEPEDQVTLMTIGDLFVRSGDTHQALAYFEKLAQLFVNDGFISKSIAIYKKIAKLAPEEIGPLERLAELYVQQGVMSEARPIYLQLAEAHLKASRTPQAIEVLRKLLDLAPDNLRVQLRLAELYQAIGQEKEAAHAFLNSGHRMLDKGDFAEAQKMAERALNADPANAHALTLKARAMAATGKTQEAVALLERMPDATAGTDTTGLLIELFLQTSQSEKAVGLARKAFARGPEHYGVVYDVAMALLDGGEAERAIVLIGEIRGALLEAGDTERMAQALAVAIERLPGRLEPLEWLCDVYRRTSDSFRLPDALDQFAEAAVAAGQLERAKEAFEELLEREPDDENNRRRLEQVCARLGVAPSERLLTARPAPVQAEAVPTVEPFATDLEVVPDVTATPAAEAPPDEETERYITQALTDVDLFSSYGLTQKGIDLLENVLQRAPGHTTALEKLLDLCLGAGNERRTSEIAAQLEQIFGEKGDAAKAEKFSELRRRFQRAADRTDEAAASATEFTIPSESAPAGDSGGHEVDLSDEWATASEQSSAQPAAAPPPPPPPPPPQQIQEFELSLDTEMEAAPPEPVAEEPPPPPAAPPPAPEPAPAEEAISYDFSLDSVEAEPAPSPVAAQPPPQPAPPAEPPKEEEAAVEYDFEVTPAGGSKAEAEAAPMVKMTSDQFLAELGEEMGDLGLGPAVEQRPSAKKPAAPPSKKKGKVAASAQAKGEDVEQLREVFNEFKADMGEMGDEEAEDLETHYNLGIAYREMGLLEEAIGEFQKVAKSIQSGRPFRYSMQCYTLLGLVFMDKSQPKIAAIWYEHALKTPDLDPESVLAVRYDLGVAQEQAGDAKAALDSFSQVYAVNIDYRDVAERIAALQKR